MKIRKANYIIVNGKDRLDRPLVIKDVGPWTRFLTVTNDAENVVRELAEKGQLPEGRRLYYYDSDGALDEIVVREGRFAGFAFPGEDGALS